MTNAKNWYKHYPLTIKLFSKRDDNDKPKMIPVKRWTQRDDTCQPILKFVENERQTNNIGMVLERLLVIDIDVGHADGVDGRKTFDKWMKSHDVMKQDEIKRDIYDTMRVNTPSGGVHIYFMLPKDMKTFDGQRSVGAMDGIDLLTGKNSYVPAPKSEREDGKYELQKISGENIIEAPEWVIDLFRKGEEIGRQNTSIRMKDELKFSSLDNGIFDKYITAMREGFDKGGRNETMTKLCGKLINDAKKGNISKANAMFVIETTGANCKPPMSKTEIYQCWNSIISRDSSNNRFDDDPDLLMKRRR
ncbi:bifunctional DNA primase/polymerase [Staphylococcus cohnii]|uniref:bifunctional DNA primase/polymerase n=1 Tax=Staphylococcus cohnii TaxID=29382 RepID=UPI00368B6C93